MREMMVSDKMLQFFGAEKRKYYSVIILNLSYIHICIHNIFIPKNLLVARLYFKMLLSFFFPPRY